VRDRVVQAALKLVLEPIWEADFQPYSYGFRPGRRAQDAIAEIHHLASHSYEWVLEGDITACFDKISHSTLLDRVRQRIADRRVLALVKAFLKAGILSEDGAIRDTVTGTPQGGILSPLLSNLALSVLDEYIVECGQANAPSWVRERRRHQGLPNYRIVRYADDFVVLVAGTRQHTEALKEQVAAVLATVGLRLSTEKTTICHIDEGFDFLGWRLQRHQQRGSRRRYVYTYPSRKALAAVKAKVRAVTGQTTNQSLGLLLLRLNWVLRGWAYYFRHGASSKTFAYLDAVAWRRVIRWLCRKHPRIGWRRLCRRYLPSWHPTEGKVTLFDPGHDRHPALPLPGHPHSPAMAASDHDRVRISRVTGGMSLGRARCRDDRHAGFGGAGRGNGPPERAAPRPGSTLLLSAGGRRVRLLAGQRPRRQEPAGPQDRCLRRRLAGGAAGAWAAAGQLRAPSPDPGAAGADPLI
jgi:RNA-directed DNA polymerase